MPLKQLRSTSGPQCYHREVVCIGTSLMPGNVPSVTGERVIRALGRAGWVEVAGGKHRILRHQADDGTLTGRVAVPVHGSQPINRRTLLAILDHIGMSVEDFQRLL